MRVKLTANAYLSVEHDFVHPSQSAQQLKFVPSNTHKTKATHGNKSNVQNAPQQNGPFKGFHETNTRSSVTPKNSPLNDNLMMQFLCIPFQGKGQFARVKFMRVNYLFPSD